MKVVENLLSNSFRTNISSSFHRKWRSFDFVFKFFLSNFAQMGSVFGKQMDENLKKQQQFMLETQRLQVSGKKTQFYWNPEFLCFSSKGSCKCRILCEKGWWPCKWLEAEIYYCSWALSLRWWWPEALWGKHSQKSPRLL